MQVLREKMPRGHVGTCSFAEARIDRVRDDWDRFHFISQPTEGSNMEDSNEDRAGFFSGGPEYKMMNMAIFAMTIVLSFDFMATFISIPFYWEQVSQGELDRFYGVFFASYQLGSLVGAPVLAKWTQLVRIHCRYLCPLELCTLCFQPWLAMFILP